MADENDGDEESTPSTGENSPYKLKYQATFHTVVSSSLLIISIVGIAAFIISLASGMKSVNKLIDMKPENRAEQFSKRIDDALKAAEKQYSEHLGKMEDKSIFTVSDKFKTIYLASEESEQDNSQMLEDYQQIVYHVASKTRGSGEWYQFYNSKLDKVVKGNKKRAIELSRYVNKNKTDPIILGE